MIVMPANATGWFWHCLARETGKLGHLYSPGAQRGPWPWFPFSLDNGAFSCWSMESNYFDDAKWDAMEVEWRKLIRWAAPMGQAKWAVVPDVPGDAQRTIERWHQYHQFVTDADICTALAVQDGMTVDDVKSLAVQPAVIAVGGTTEWKWETVESWAKAFPRVHVLRCNSPEKLYMLEALGVESCDGTGWNRGDRKQTAGLENWARRNPKPRISALTPFTSRSRKTGQQELFAI